MLEENNKIVVVLSGGQDSVTCLGLALATVNMFGGEVHAIGFDYDQKHQVELEQAREICDLYGVPFVVHTIPSLALLADSALINGGEGEVSDAHHSNENLPASFVPNRNAMFLTIAHAYAQKIGSRLIMTGVCQTDYSGYPDCRRIFIDSLQLSLNLGYETKIEINTPLMYLNKAETFQMAKEYNFLEIVIEKSHTCYEGDRSIKHDWGYGCGECPACKLRAKGYAEFLELEAGGNNV